MLSKNEEAEGYFQKIFLYENVRDDCVLLILINLINNNTYWVADISLIISYSYISGSKYNLTNQISMEEIDNKALPSLCSSQNDLL